MAGLSAVQQEIEVKSNFLVTEPPLCSAPLQFAAERRWLEVGMPGMKILAISLIGRFKLPKGIQKNDKYVDCCEIYILWKILFTLLIFENYKLYNYIILFCFILAYLILPYFIFILFDFILIYLILFYIIS